jgi:hydroxypyruvate reductase
MTVDILVTAALPPFLYEPLRRDYGCHDLVAAADRQALLDSTGSRIRGLVQGGGTITGVPLLDALPKLEVISVFGVGYDGVPVEYCRARGIMVGHTPDVLTSDVADVAAGLVLMTARGFVQADRFVRAGAWLRGGPTLTTRLGGKSAGILGLGRIGRAIARRLAAMDMIVSYSSRRPQADVAWRYVPDLATLAAEVDFLIVACPGGAATRNLVDARVLAALGSKGTLINVARGSIVDEPALVDALQRGVIRGAGLDVFADEPNVPPALVAMENVVLLPHVGSATRETRQAMADLCRANLDAWFAGKPLPAPIPELAR